MLPNNTSSTIQFVFSTVLFPVSAREHEEHSELLDYYFKDSYFPLMNYMNAIEPPVSFSVSLINEEPQIAFKLTDNEVLTDSTFLQSEINKKTQQLQHNIPSWTQTYLFPEERTSYLFNETHPSLMFHRVKEIYHGKIKHIKDESVIKMLALMENYRHSFRVSPADSDRFRKVSSLLDLIEEGYRLSLISFLLLNETEGLSLEFMRQRNISPDLPDEWAKELIL